NRSRQNWLRSIRDSNSGLGLVHFRLRHLVIYLDTTPRGSASIRPNVVQRLSTHVSRSCITASMVLRTTLKIFWPIVLKATDSGAQRSSLISTCLRTHFSRLDIRSIRSFGVVGTTSVILF